LASVAPFLCLIVAHFECPDMTNPLFCVFPAWRDPRSEISCGRAPRKWRLADVTPLGGA